MYGSREILGLSKPENANVKYNWMFSIHQKNSATECDKMIKEGEDIFY